MKKKNLIVFDIDDTLTKSEYQHQKAYVDTMVDFGILEINQDWKSYENVTDSFILKENYEMNFKKLLVSKCQKQFFKMLNIERGERQMRRDSMHVEVPEETADSKPTETPKG